MFLLLVTLSPCTYADAFYEFIKYDCNQNEDLVQVQLMGAYDEEGEALRSNSDENTWSPWELVGDGGTGRYIKSTRTINKSCTLSDGAYSVEIGPKPCNYDTQGRNGAKMMAWAEISKNGEQLAYVNFGACGVVDVTVTTKLSVKPGHEPTIERKPGKDYFK